jgi:hypothetical protein
MAGHSNKMSKNVVDRRREMDTRLVIPSMRRPQPAQVSDRSRVAGGARQLFACPRSVGLSLSVMSTLWSSTITRQRQLGIEIPDLRKALRILFLDIGQNLFSNEAA